MLSEVEKKWIVTAARSPSRASAGGASNSITMLLVPTAALQGVPSGSFVNYVIRYRICQQCKGIQSSKNCPQEWLVDSA
jgi:hypothetical protein